MTELSDTPQNLSPRRRWMVDGLLILVLLLAAGLRLIGLYWGEYQYLHPDERFLVWVGTDISPVSSLSDYFDTANSSLNPVNRGHGFYVYGTLPMFVTRYAVEWIFGHSGFMEMTQVGRALSALADLLTVLLVFLIAERLYDWRVGLLGAAFSATAVLQIQQSHFFTMDTFLTLFAFLAFYFAVRILLYRGAWVGESPTPDMDMIRTTGESEVEKPQSLPAMQGFFSHPFFWLSVAFGVAFGLAMASKINAIPMALALPAAFALHLYDSPRQRREARLATIFGYLVVAGMVSVLVFRIFQPYAFSGPGFLGLKLDPTWLGNIREQRAQSTDLVDFPPAMQWARRSITFSGKNLTLWGLGLPLGLLAWAGFLWAGWRILASWGHPSGEWRRHYLLWFWTALYFGWQSLALNPTMRYQLLVYPSLAIFAAWGVVALYDRGKGKQGTEALQSAQAISEVGDPPPIPYPLSPRARRAFDTRTIAVIVGSLVFLLTLAYAVAFTTMYTRPITRIAATRWILQNIPGPITLRIQTEQGPVNQPLPFPYETTISTYQPVSTGFQVNKSGQLSEVYLPHIKPVAAYGTPLDLSLVISEMPNGERPIAQGRTRITPQAASGPVSTDFTLTLDQPVAVTTGQPYYLTFAVESPKLSFCHPLTLAIAGATGPAQQSIPATPNCSLPPNSQYVVDLPPGTSGTLTQIFVPDPEAGTERGSGRSLVALVYSADQQLAKAGIALGSQNLQPGPGDEAAQAQGYLLNLDQPVALDAGGYYYLSLQVTEDQPVTACGPLLLQILTVEGNLEQTFPALPQCVIRPSLPYVANFTAQESGLLPQIFLPAVTNLDPASGAQATGPYTLKLDLYQGGIWMTSAVATVDLANPENHPELGAGYAFNFEPALELVKGENYSVSLGFQTGQAGLSLRGAGIANEGEWDDGLPLRMDGYDPFGGIYPLDLNFNMYWDDNPDKLARFTRILNESDYLVISSSRQWGSLPRIPERFPMTTVYYRNLLGCPPEREIDWCYSVAQPDMFTGNLGYELVQVFESPPTLGPIRLNDQFAEEAFTVYDHPKVLIFRKTAGYNPQQVASILGAVDFSKVIRIPPMKAAAYPLDLMLPENRLAEQRAGGTWSELFNTQALYNRYPALGLVLWYLTVALLGVLFYPILRLAFPGLSDRGYPMARTAGMLVLSYLVWLAGSARIPFTRPTILAGVGLIALTGAVLAYRQRDEIRQELRTRSRYFLMVEGLALAFFLFDLLIRLGNPDLWHPFKGGERPMDFSYFNAVLKSTSFPPYDPWYAGGYLNYYYYGFVLVGTLVKLLGIVPSVAFNLILPTVFMLIALGAFSLGWNLLARPSNRHKTTGAGLSHPAEAMLLAGGSSPPAGMDSGEIETPDPDASPRLTRTASLQFWGGLAASLGMAVLGNLGTLRMIYQGYQRLAAPDGVVEGAGMLTRTVWALRGFVMALTGSSLHYGLGDWYWIPSRVIPPKGEIEPITEFPFFTVLYSDPHAHLFALPIALLALAFALAIVMGRARWRSWVGAVAAFLLGGLAIGALRPTNTWDLYTYLAIGIVATVYAVWANTCRSAWDTRSLPFLDSLTPTIRRVLYAGAAALALAILASALYRPYLQWYGQGYNKVGWWTQAHTPLNAYFTHWGLFLFVLVTWMAWESRDWMANTPLSALRKLEPFKNLILAALVLLAITVIGLLFIKVPVALVALPLAAWAGVLLLRPDQPDAKRFVLFLVGTGLVLTFVVEVLVLKGDIDRMNTVFKFYLQVWTLFAVCAAAALGWLLAELPEWLPRWRTVWSLAFTALVFGAALFTIMGSMAKIKDRMATNAPHTLDGMAYMQYARYGDDWGEMDLSQDYHAIRWLQENVQGSPVIVEANLRALYRWGSRMTIYTGLPGVVGWEWHQQQQRAVVPPNWISDRIAEIDAFYTTTDLELAHNFLRKYDVGYIILGQQERGHYPGPGLDKFPAAEGILWREVYRDQDTVIYAVQPG